MDLTRPKHRASSTPSPRKLSRPSDRRFRSLLREQAAHHSNRSLPTDRLPCHCHRRPTTGCHQSTLSPHLSQEPLTDAMNRKRRRSDADHHDATDVSAKNCCFGLDIRTDPLPLITDDDVRPQPGVAFRYKCPAPDCRRRSVSTQWLLTHLHENHGYHRYDIETVYQNYFDEVDRRRLLWSLRLFSTPRSLEPPPNRVLPAAAADNRTIPVSARKHAARLSTAIDTRRSSTYTPLSGRLPDFIPVGSDRAQCEPATSAAHRSGRYFHLQPAAHTDSGPTIHTPSLPPVQRRSANDSEFSSLMDCFTPIRVAPPLDWSLFTDDLSWEARFGPAGILPYGFFYLPGEPTLRRLSDAMTDRERAFGAFIYDDISEFRHRFAENTDIRRFVEREHAAHHRQLHRLPAIDAEDSRPYWNAGPWCTACCCHHFESERCLPPLKPVLQNDDIWTIPSAAVADQSPDAAVAAATPDINRNVIFRHQLNPPPAVGASLSLDREAAQPATSSPTPVNPCTLGNEAAQSETPEVTSSPSAASASNHSSVSLFADDLTEPLDSLLATLHAEGKMPLLSDIIATISSFLRANSDKLVCDLHSYVCSSFPPAQRLLAETVALSIQNLVQDTDKLQDVIHCQRIELMTRDR